MRVKGQVQLSTYRMRSHLLRVAEEFLQHVRSLPLEYEKGVYFAFLEDYGTHYTRNGKSGGEYELVYVLNQDTIKAKSEQGLLRLDFPCFTPGNSLVLVWFFPPRSDREDDSGMHEARHHGGLRYSDSDRGKGTHLTRQMWRCQHEERRSVFIH